MPKLIDEMECLNCALPVEFCVGIPSKCKRRAELAAQNKALEQQKYQEKLKSNRERYFRKKTAQGVKK